MERPLSSQAVLIVEQSSHILFSAFSHLLPSVVPSPMTTLSASGLRCGQSFVSLPAIVELVDCLLAVVSTIAILPAPLSALLQLAMPVIRRFPGLLFSIKDSPLMPCLLLLLNRLQHIVTVLSGHQRGQIPPSKPHCL